MKSKNDEIIVVRAHHLMCFHAYSGRGYNREFIERMDYLKDLFLKNPLQKVSIISSPDTVCGSCPNLSKAGCNADGTDDQEERVRIRDRKVMSLTGINEGEILAIRDAFKRVENSITGEMLDDICADCDWLPNSRCRVMVNVDFWKSNS